MNCWCWQRKDSNLFINFVINHGIVKSSCKGEAVQSTVRFVCDCSSYDIYLNENPSMDGKHICGSYAIFCMIEIHIYLCREIDMGASLIVEMDAKKTRLHKPKLSSLRDNVRDTTNDFTFDYSYWSFDVADKHYTTQEQVYKDLGTDVINCAFQGKDIIATIL